MFRRKIIYGLLLVLFATGLILAVIIFHSKNQELKIVFLDVGQGDAILIEQGEKQILIDGGPSEKVLLEKLGKYMPFWDREIEVIVATHPDQDHIQGLIGALKNYRVANLIETTARSESQLDKRFEELIDEKQIARIKGEKGLAVTIGGARLEILGPSVSVPEAVVKDTNGYSLVSKLVFGDSSFLLTGDLPEKEEMRMVADRADMKSTFLKVAHHGSKYATTDNFLSYVRPKEAIISVGKNNRFGHPAPEVLERLEKNDIPFLRTDEQGDIRFDCSSLSHACALVAN